MADRTKWTPEVIDALATSLSESGWLVGKKLPEGGSLRLTIKMLLQRGLKRVEDGG
jgi:hypothetical protein